MAIIGAGFSGALVAAQLLGARGCNEVVLIERIAQFGPGLACWGDDKTVFAYVRAAKMSALQSAPDDFVRWLRPKMQAGVGDIFAQRSRCGHYIEYVLQSAERQAFGRLKRVRAVAGGRGCSMRGTPSRAGASRADVLLVGTGLTAIDVALALDAQKHTGAILRTVTAWPCAQNPNNGSRSPIFPSMTFGQPE